MHIKRLIIRGFKSYSDQLEVNDFSEHHNVVVGRNGSGKSNFFQAICFVLCDDHFENLRKEERVELLHEGTGQRALSAFVEIVFDNSDKRLPYDTDTVSLRRQIGLQRDEFFVNGKHLSRADVINMLESAGFSRSNPYYIVKQGKINALALMSNRQRLELLKEVAGTRVYEDRRSQSWKIFQNAIKKRQNTNEISVYIEERLDELEEEKKELGEYQVLDKGRRALEYVLYDKDLTDARRQVEVLDSERDEESLAASEVHQTVRDTQMKMTELQSELDKVQDEAVLMESEAAERKSARASMLQKRAELQLDSNELSAKVQTESAKQNTLKQESMSLDQRIAQAREDLNERVGPAFAKEMARKTKLEGEFEGCKSIVDNLHAKQGRALRFTTADERDVFLKDQIKDMSTHLKHTKTTITNLQVNLATLNKGIQNAENDMGSKKSELEKQKGSIGAISVDIEKLRVGRNNAIETRKILWKTEAQIDERNVHAREELARSERSLKALMPPGVAAALESIEALMKSDPDNIGKRCYGPLMGLIDPVKPVYRKPMEVVAGSALFQVIVDTDDTAVKIMKHLTKERAGRVTFVPLNRISDRKLSFPSGDDFVPLVEKIEFPEEIYGAVAQVFGSTLICRDIDTAAYLSNQHRMDCVTLEGDQVLRHGILRGGYHDAHRSPMDYTARIVNAKEMLEEGEQAAKKVKEDVRKADVAVNTKFQEMQNLDMKRARSRKALAVLAHALEPLQRHHTNLKEQCAEKEERLAIHIADQRTNEAKISALNAELGTPLTEDLDQEEKNLLKEKKEKMARLQTEMDSHREVVYKVRSQKAALEALLSSNLLFRRAQVTSSLATDGKEQYEERLLKVKDELNQLIEHVVELETRLETLGKEVAKRKLRADKIRSELDDLSETFETEQDTLDTAQKKVEKMLNKRNLALQKRDNAIKMIRDLGSLPSEEIEKYKVLPISKIRTLLEETNENLKKYNHVNKKALDQYVNFNETRGQLVKRKEEIDRSEESIKRLIRHLDRQKDEAIMRTFNGVKEHFAEVFRELVPSGKGALILERRDQDAGGEQGADDDGSDSDDDVDASQGENDAPTVKSFVGVGVKVSFGGELESTMTSSLSGGQKALVALALIFAIQRCDPAPFYLFDEIDQALDGTHRSAVASLIHRQSHSKDRPAQFICSTFSPELVEVADTHFGVAHQHKISAVKSFSHEDAMTFIQEIQKDTEAPLHHASGRVSSYGGSDAASVSSNSSSRRGKRSRSSMLSEKEDSP